MAEARLKHQWDHTSHVLWLLASVHRDPKKTKPYHPRQFHPFRRKQPKPFSVARFTDEVMMVAKAKQKARS